MHYADWIVLAVYIVVMVAIGFWANRKQTDTEAYFVGNRNMKWWAAGISIIATSFSAASILGVPGYAYSTDMWYLQYQLGDIAAAIVVVLLFIPFFHSIKGLTTAYEYLEARFDLKTRLLGSSLFSLTVLLRAGTLLFGAALLFSAVAPTNLMPGLDGVEEAVVIFGVVAIIYTVMGGISAVIWTDVIQFGIMSLGIFASMAVVVLGTPGGWGQAFAEADALGKLDIIHLEEPLGGQGLLTAIFGYGLLALSLFGTNQQPVQRYMTVKAPREAQQALMLGVAAGVIGIVMSLLLGVFMFIFYEHFPALLQREPLRQFHVVLVERLDHVIVPHPSGHAIGDDRPDAHLAVLAETEFLHDGAIEAQEHARIGLRDLQPVAVFEEHVHQSAAVAPRPLARRPRQRLPGVPLRVRRRPR